MEKIKGPDRRMIMVPVSNQFLIEMITQGSFTGAPSYFGVRCTNGIPEDAEFIGTAHDDRALCAYFIFRHPSFEEVDFASQLPIRDITFTRENVFEVAPGLTLKLTGGGLVVRRDTRRVERLEFTPHAIIVDDSLVADHSTEDDEYSTKDYSLREDMKALRAGPVETEVTYRSRPTLDEPATPQE